MERDIKERFQGVFSQLGWVLMPLGACMLFLILLTGLLKLSVVTPSWFPVEKAGGVRAVLCPTLLSNGGILVGYGIAALLTVAMLVWWLVKCMRNASLADALRGKLFLLLLVCAGLPIFLGYFMIHDEDVGGIAAACARDLRLYKAGQSEVYRGPLEFVKPQRMDGPYTGGQPKDFRSRWSTARGEALYAYGALSTEWEPEKNREYVVEYLPNTGTIVTISPA